MTLRSLGTYACEALVWAAAYNRLILPKVPYCVCRGKFCGSITSRQNLLNEIHGIPAVNTRHPSSRASRNHCLHHCRQNGTGRCFVLCRTLLWKLQSSRPEGRLQASSRYIHNPSGRRCHSSFLTNAPAGIIVCRHSSDFKRA